MKKLATNISALCVAALLGSSVSFAQTPAPAAPAAPAAAAPAAAKPATPAAAPEKAAKAAKPAKTMEAKSAKAKACSMKADEQKLHGKERKKFRAECKKAA